jgi:hypothetical protein
LWAVHLSDNDLVMSRERSRMDPTGTLMEEYEYFEEVLNIFGLKYTDIFGKKKPKDKKEFRNFIKQAHIDQLDLTGYTDKNLLSQKRQFMLDK